MSNVVNCGIYLFSMSIFETLAKVASSARKSMKLSESYDIFPENRPRFADTRNSRSVISSCSRSSTACKSA